MHQFMIEQYELANAFYEDKKNMYLENPTPSKQFAMLDAYEQACKAYKNMELYFQQNPMVQDIEHISLAD